LKVRFLADENVHGKVVQSLREYGLDVEWIKESSRGIADPFILRRADIGLLVLITNDRDFGDLIFNKGLPLPHALLYTRLPHRDWQNTADRLIAVIETGVSAGHIVTMTIDRNRTSPFPPGARHD
jgi:predicted nuclease of predicted toxin-antitoxin system